LTRLIRQTREAKHAMQANKRRRRDSDAEETRNEQHEERERLTAELAQLNERQVQAMEGQERMNQMHEGTDTGSKDEMIEEESEKRKEMCCDAGHIGHKLDIRWTYVGHTYICVPHHTYTHYTPTTHWTYFGHDLDIPSTTFIRARA